MFEVGKAKSAAQSVLMILTLNGYSKKFSTFFTLPLEIPDKRRLHKETLHNHVTPFKNF